ncbi:proline utilization transcriptional regulator PutR [Bacillus vallismortis]|uniref:Proline utilization transcriptional regulator PutR n=2 Tax=Bacillus TaxID=1386 RepID=A0ABY4XZY5_BACVA|nr:MULTISPECIES: proline utilization transcriptional regulator PutR [Bacillus]MBL3649557.1 proline utilization transcriptional regulator PutR [Bacillus sp. RHFS10]TYS09520.1 proline utilization transcriptional regulator PutR [Bacillus subtilis]USP95848.1 proline utilization transcriptional regulator PutR [Bacillus vallismortis]
MEELLERVFSFSDVDKLIDFISYELQKPVILESADFFLLAYNSYYINHFDSANQQTIFSKKCPVQIFERFLKDGVIEKLKTEPEPFRVNKIESIGLNQRVVVSAKHKGDVMGYIWVQELDQNLTEEELDFLYETSFHVGKIIYKTNKLKQEKEEKAEDLVKRAIYQQFTSEKELKREAERINTVLPSMFSVVILHAANGDGEAVEDLKENIRSYLNLRDKVSHVLTIDSNIVIVVASFSQKSSVSSAASEFINKLLTHFHFQRIPTPIYIGIGNEYDHLLKLGKSYTEALEVIKAAEITGNQENIPYEYAKLGIYRYLESIEQKNKFLKYENKDLALLKAKDQESSTELLKTLEIYLLNNCKTKPAAEQLFIHQNTLNYRIKQITEMTSINLSDFRTRCQLYLDLMLMKKK